MIITIANQKGGVGKSTTAHALGAGLAQRGKRVLFIDLDAQANLSLSLNTQEGKKSTYELLTRRASIQNAVQHLGAYDAVPASALLANADLELTMTGKEYRLKEAITPVAGAYDFIIIDTPPALGALTVNALTASDAVLIPAQADIYSWSGIEQIIGTIRTVREYCNPSLKILGIVLTRYSARAVLSRDIADRISETAAKYGTRAYQAAIREAIVIKEAQAMRQSIYEYAPKSRAAADYDALIDEIFQEEVAVNG